jgi:hypothetical protein
MPLPEKTSPFIVAGGFDYLNAYFHRGYLQQGGGAVLQAYATISRLYKPTDELIVRPYVTFFNSTGGWGNPGQHPMGAYVSELMGGVFATRGAATADVYYNLYFYPAMQFAQEVGGKVSYDVATLWQEPRDAALAVKPYAALYYGSLNHIGMGRGYFEAGLEPAWRMNWCDHKIGISLPTSLGMNVDGYYFNAAGGSQFLGFWSTGVAASTQLPSPGGCGGSWFLSGSVQYLDLIANNIATLNGRRDTVVFKVGVGILY